MTEFELESLIKNALFDRENVPEEINQKLKAKLYKKSKFNKRWKAFPVSAAACLVIGVMISSVILGQNANKPSEELHLPIAANERTYAVTMDMARGARTEAALSFDVTLLCDVVENLKLVGERVKEYIKSNPVFEFYENFEGVSGNERCYLEDSGELIVIFDPGTIAPEEHGEIYINVGVIE